MHHQQMNSSSVHVHIQVYICKFINNNNDTAFFAVNNINSTQIFKILMSYEIKCQEDRNFPFRRVTV